MTRIALIAVVLLLAVAPGQASAQFGGPFPQQSEDYGPGITVAGAGFAPFGDRAAATSRAVGDARRRAESIAMALNVPLGEVRIIETSTPFGGRPRCEPGDNRRRCATLEAVSAEVTFAIQGSPTDDETAREVSGSGQATAPVDAPRKTSASIRHGLRAARLSATPDAANVAQANAQAAATAAGIPLGPLFSVSEQGNPYGYDPVLGAFGPGQFCSRFRRARLVRDPETARRRVVRGKLVLRCFRTRNFPVTLEATYLGA